MAFNVLVVDDSAVMRQMVVRTLRMSGLPLGSVLEAGNGEEGLFTLQEQWVDLLLLDINMPVMNGEEMLRRLRANPETAHIPFVFLTARAEEDLRVTLKRAGANDYLAKPFTLEQLHAVIEGNLIS